MSTSAERLGLPVTLPMPSPSRSNPFARPNLPKAGSFTRTSLLPTLPSPVKPVEPSIADSTPSGKAGDTAGSTRSVEKARSAWRLLWRGGLEIGPDGYRLDGITFFALLNFPSTPSQPVSNPFDTLTTPSQHSPASAHPQSPFALPSADTDICLSLESMRGRKYLHIKGVEDLLDTDVLEGSDNDPGESGVSCGNPSGVQMAISPSSPLLIAYFTGLLCRDEQLGKKGRTKKAVLLGLGDDDSPANTLLIYGQLQSGNGTLRLMVGRRRPPAPPSEVKPMVKPGDPLPRAPLFFPVKKGKPLPFPNRNTLSKSRSFSRTSSVSSIYAPPCTVPSVVASGAAGSMPERPNHHPVHATGNGRTPGRRGEKRRKIDPEADEERRRKAGKIVMVVKEETDGTAASRDGPALMERIASEGSRSRAMGEGEAVAEEEDIFGKRASLLDVQQPSAETNDAPGESQAMSAAKKRVRIPQQVLDNKALIRKQTMVMMEARGYPRDHEIFKDVFAITIKGVYFVFRDALLHGLLEKARVQHFVARHLDMYLPTPAEPSGDEAIKGADGSDDDTAVDDEPLFNDRDLAGGKHSVAGDTGLADAGVGEDESEGSLPPRGSSQVHGGPEHFSPRRRSMDVVQEEEEEEEGD